MSIADLDTLFERIYRIIGDPRFLRMEGLGNEVPFFIQPYDVRRQDEIYRRIDALTRRLSADGVEPLLLSLYDIALQRFTDRNQLEKLITKEPQITKAELQKNMEKMVNPETVVAPLVRTMVQDSQASLVILYQVGEVFPYLRTHTVLNNLHSVVRSMPLVVFFPGSYVSSDRHGFYLSLFGKFNGDYYRAFHLEDYIERGRIDVNA